jgi:GNAT superfamily N-acetyltransferase
VCGLARRDGGDLVVFARVVSDWATFAWLCDVFVVPEARGRGLARGLVAALMAAPDLQGLRRWALATADAHGVYAPLGFAPISAPERWMEIKRPSPYGVLTA